MFTERTKIDNISLIYGTENNRPKTVAGARRRLQQSVTTARRRLGGFKKSVKKKKKSNKTSALSAVPLSRSSVSSPDGSRREIHVARDFPGRDRGPEDRRPRRPGRADSSPFLSSLSPPPTLGTPPSPSVARDTAAARSRKLPSARASAKGGGGPHARRRQIAVAPDANARPRGHHGDRADCRDTNRFACRRAPVLKN